MTYQIVRERLTRIKLAIEQANLGTVERAEYVNDQVIIKVTGDKVDGKISTTTNLVSLIMGMLPEFPYLGRTKTEKGLIYMILKPKNYGIQENRPLHNQSV